MSDELVVCRLRCGACFADASVALPGDAKARELLRELACAQCGHRGAMAFAKSEMPASTAADYSQPPDLEGDEYLLERRKRFR